MASLIEITKFCHKCNHEKESYNEMWTCEACDKCYWDGENPSEFEESEEN